MCVMTVRTSVTRAHAALVEVEVLAFGLAELEEVVEVEIFWERACASSTARLYQK